MDVIADGDGGDGGADRGAVLDDLVAGRDGAAGELVAERQVARDRTSGHRRDHLAGPDARPDDEDVVARIEENEPRVIGGGHIRWISSSPGRHVWSAQRSVTQAATTKSPELRSVAPASSANNTFFAPSLPSLS